MNSLAARIRNTRTLFLYRALPGLVDGLVTLSTLPAGRKLAQHRPVRLLVDNTVLAHSVTHETAWVDTGKKPWGGTEIDTGHVARIPVHADDADSPEARSIRFLPGIASLAKRGRISLHCSSELIDERWMHPVGRFRGSGICDFSLLRGVKIGYIRDPDYTLALEPGRAGLPSVQEQRRRRLAGKTDPLFLGLLDALGPKNSQDAYHIYTAQEHGCFCFLTMDFRLIKAVRSQAGHRAIKALTTRVMSPEEFGAFFDLQPIPPRLFSYHDASYPVLSGENWPDSRRRKLRRSAGRTDEKEEA